MYILLPPSEGKWYPPAQEAVGADAQPSFLEMVQDLAFPQLDAFRLEVARELVRVSGQPDALEVLNLTARMGDLVEANQALMTLPRAMAAQIYTGVLYDHAQLMEHYVGQDNGAVRVLIASALYGLIEPEDVIAPYRLQMQVRLGQLGPLGAYWKAKLEADVTTLVAGQLVLDGRSGAYLPIWSPKAKVLAEHDIDYRAIKVVQEVKGVLKTVSHHAKAYRGAVVKALSGGVVQPGQDTLEQVVQHLAAMEDIRDIDTSQPGVLTLLTHA